MDALSSCNEKALEDMGQFIVQCCMARNGHSKSRKRARTEAYELADVRKVVTESAMGVLPGEMLQEIVGRIAPRDLPAAAASGVPLSAAVQAALKRQLTQALAIADVVEVDEDPLGALVVLHNAISRDDPVTTKAILDAGLAHAINEPLPPIKIMVEWDTPIVAVFYLGNDGTMDHDRSSPWDRKDGKDINYDIDNDVSSTGAAGVLRSWRVLPHTPLVRAVQCGARRCVRTLLAAGARPHPSPEALLGGALDRIFLTHVAIAERHHVRRFCDDGYTWAPQPHRYTERVGIVEDLTAAFARTPPPLPLFDDNPLTMLRYGALISCRRGHGTVETDLTRALNAIIGAGYAPDERMARLPPRWAVLGTPEERGDLLLHHTADSRPWKPRDAFGSRRAPDTETERQAAAIMCGKLINTGAKETSLVVAMAILAAYERMFPRPATCE